MNDPDVCASPASALDCVQGPRKCLHQRAWKVHGAYRAVRVVSGQPDLDLHCILPSTACAGNARRTSIILLLLYKTHICAKPILASSLRFRLTLSQPGDGAGALGRHSATTPRHIYRTSRTVSSCFRKPQGSSCAKAGSCRCAGQRKKSAPVTNLRHLCPAHPAWKNHLHSL